MEIKEWNYNTDRQNEKIHNSYFDNPWLDGMLS